MCAGMHAHVFMHAQATGQPVIGIVDHNDHPRCFWGQDPLLRHGLID